MHFLIGVDVGTSGCKVMIFDEIFRPCSSASRSYMIDSPRSGWAQFDPEAIWGAVCLSVREALGRLAIDPQGHSFSMSFSVFGDGLIACDRMGQPVYPGILSADLRSVAIAERLERDLGREYCFQKTGRMPHTMAVITKIIWLKENLPELMTAETRFLDVHAWLYGRLGVGTLTDPSLASGTTLLDINDKTWSPDLMGYAGITADNLPTVVPAGTKAGRPGADAARALGFSGESQVQVIVGAMDQMCNAVGSGTVSPGDAMCSMGTVEAVNIVLYPDSDSRALMDFNMPRAPSAVPEQFLALVVLWDGGRSLRWFADNFAQKQKEDAAREGTSVYEELLRHEPKARSMLFLPHLSGSGTPTQNPASRGAFLGLTTASDAVSAAHAIIEGVTFELKLNLDNLASVGTHIKELCVVGGGSRSDRWLQLKADILQREVFRLAVGEAGSMGAAILAGYGSGLFDDLADIARQVIRKTDVFTPSDAVDYYREKYEVYRQIYPALEKINRAISSLDASSGYS